MVVRACNPRTWEAEEEQHTLTNTVPRPALNLKDKKTKSIKDWYEVEMENCAQHVTMPWEKSDWEESARMQLLMWSLGVSSSPGITGKFLQGQVSTKSLLN